MTELSSPMRRPSDERSPAPPRREPRDALKPGTVLGGGYRLERTLGQGGFGIVYLATDLALQRPIAIKEYLPVQLAGRGEGTAVGLREAGHKEAFLRGLDSFLREARLLAQFDHPALVRVYRFWEENHTAYMAMPYCEGPTLLAARQGMLRPPDEQWLRERLLLPLLGALQTLHEGQCLHRDVAPGNILLKPDGQPVLLDFGSARRVVADMTQPLTAIINPSFAAIEQYAESSTLPQGPWTDVYGLAAVAYFAMSGRAPVPATVRAVNDAALMPVAEVAQEIERSFPGLRYSAPFLAALDAALAVRPGDRPQDTLALRKALVRLHVQPDVTVEGPPLQAVPLKPAEPAAGSSAEPPAAGKDEEEAPGEQAIRAAIDAALAGIGDWPPMTRRPGRIDPVLAQEPPQREETPVAADDAPATAANKVALKVVPGGEAAAQPRTEPPTGRPEPVPAAADATAAPAAWAATAPAVGVVPAAAMPLHPGPVVPPAAPTPLPPAAPPRPPVEQPLPERAMADDKPTEPLGAWLPPEPEEAMTAPERSEFTTTARRRSAWPWALAAGLAALVAGGTWLAQHDERFAVPLLADRPTQAPAATAAVMPRPTPPQPTREATPAPAPVPAPETSPPVAAAPRPTASAPDTTVSIPATTEAAAPPTPITAAPVTTVTAAPEPERSQARAEAPRPPRAEDTRATVSSSGTASARKAAASADAPPRSTSSRAKPPARTAAVAAAPKAAVSPRAECGDRTNFSLYYCMKKQCAQSRFSGHAQCKRLRETDEVS